jgi:probable HAF family extracellular repeat protein
MTHFYLVIDLGTLPGGNSSSAAAINDLGQVVGSSDVAGGTEHAFLWRAGALQDLGTLPGSNSGTSGISTCGQVAGQSNFTGSGTDTHAFVWSSGSLQDLGTLPGDNGSAAVAISACGQVVGNSSLSAGGNCARLSGAKARA